MKKLFIRFITILILSFVSAGAQSLDTIRVMTYNILNYNGSSRSNYLNTVVSSVDPDVIIVQEMLSQTGVDSFLANVLNNEYITIKFNNGRDTDNHIFYKYEKVVFINAKYLTTSLRDIAEYEVRIKSNDETVFFYSMHLKASNNETDRQRRLAEVTVLREHLQWHYPGTNFIVLGDFNVYYSNEPAYQKLIQEENNIHSQSFDPINKPGSWHSSSNYASVHTQSPRAVDIGDGGSPGGLDDRFDFILISAPLGDNVNVPSYTTYGNDGAHFNISINDAPTNSAVGQAMADSIFYASDHLPVYCDFVFEIATSIEYESDANPQKFQLYQNYPNPFNPSTIISFNLPESEHVVLTVFDILGKKVRTVLNESLHAGFHEIEFNAGQLPGSVYFYRLQAGESIQTRKFILLK